MTTKRSFMTSPSMVTIIKTAGLSRVKSLKKTADGYELEFFPESAEQITPAFHPSLLIDPTEGQVPEHIKKEVEALQEEDEHEMQILEDPAEYERMMVHQLVNGDDDEE